MVAHTLPKPAPERAGRSQNERGERISKGGRRPKPGEKELTFDALLRADIVRLTMASDGVTERDILALKDIVPLVTAGSGPH